MRHPLYLLYGALMISWLGYSSYHGRPFIGASVNEVKNVPRTVRDNPGAYRAIYGGYPRYVGGK